MNMFINTLRAQTDSNCQKSIQLLIFLGNLASSQKVQKNKMVQSHTDRTFGGTAWPYPCGAE